MNDKTEAAPLHDSLRDRIGQAISDEIAAGAEQPDWCDSREIDRLADAVLAVLTTASSVPFMCAIMGPDGTAHIDENCVSASADSTALHIEVNCLNDSPDTGYSIVPLYLAAPQQHAQAAQTNGLTTLLQAAGAMRLVRCHDGSGEPFEAYDKTIADRVVFEQRAKVHGLEAKIDALMLEHCPDEMSPEQIKNWGDHQRAVIDSRVTGNAQAALSDDLLLKIRYAMEGWGEQESIRRARAILAARQPTPVASAPAVAVPKQPELTVWYGPMPESNGKSNFSATLMRKGASLFDTNQFTFSLSEYPDRVRYDADSMRYLIGELEVEPALRDYDADKHSGYVEPQPSAAPVAAAMQGLRGKSIEIKVGDGWVPAKFIATDLVGGEPIVQMPGRMPDFYTWPEVRGLTAAEARAAQPPADAAPVVAAVAQGDPDAAFAQFCDREGYPSDGPFDAALRKAFDAGVTMMVSHACRSATQPPADAAPAWDAAATERLRSIVDLLGLQSSVPEGDLTGYEFSVLGVVRREIARLKAAQPSTAQGDALSQDARAVGKICFDELSTPEWFVEPLADLSSFGAGTLLFCQANSERDAARYRELRDHGLFVVSASGIGWAIRRDEAESTSDEMDAAMDEHMRIKAMAAQQGEKGGTS